MPVEMIWDILDGMTYVLDMAYTEESPAPLRVAPRRRMSEKEFLAWCDDQGSAEWVNGQAVVLAPMTIFEDAARGFFCALLHYYSERAGGSVHGRPYQVRLNAKVRRAPDLFFVGGERADMIREYECDGAPELVLEILGPDTLARDWREKFNEYEAAGVAEYWIFDPFWRRLHAFQNTAVGLVPIRWKEGRMTSAALPGMFIESRWIQATQYAKLTKCAKELGWR